MISFSSTKRGSKNRQESDVQKECWSWLGGVHHSQDGIKPLQDFCYMVPNGTQLAGGRQRRAQYMASLKAQGFRPGVSDIVIAYPTFEADFGGDYSGHHAAYIELKKEPELYGGPKAIKARRTAVRPEQRDWLELMSSVGYFASIAWGTEDFKRLVRLFLRRESPPPLDWDDRPCDTGSAQ